MSKPITDKIADLVNTYKLTVLLMKPIIIKNDNKTISSLFEVLKETWSAILKTIEDNYPSELYNRIKDFNLNTLPEELLVLQNVEIYNKILALKYLDLKPDSIKDKIKLDKISIDLNYQEEFAYIDIAKNLLKDKKYVETVKLCEFIKTFSESAPVWEISADAYKELGLYGNAIEGYTTYLTINDGDDEVKEKLSNIYKTLCEEYVK